VDRFYSFLIRWVPRKYGVVNNGNNLEEIDGQKLAKIDDTSFRESGDFLILSKEEDQLLAENEKLKGF